MTRDLTFKCQSTTIPQQGVVSFEVALHGVKIPFAGTADFGGQQITTTFLETVDWATRQKLLTWRKLTRDWRSNSGSSSAVYKINAQIALYDDTPSVVRVVQLNGLYLETMNDVELNSEAQAVMLQCVFRFTDTEDL